jgi:hypothetical protein
LTKPTLYFEAGALAAIALDPLHEIGLAAKLIGRRYSG